MLKMFLCLVFAFLCVSYSDQRSTPEDPTYRAAVVEYQVFADSATNLQNYVQLIQDAGAQEADIVVFPEMTLVRGRGIVIPMNSTLRENPIPALAPDLFDEVLVSISAAARQNQIYVVINVEEFVNCILNLDGEDCPETRLYFFNTNVVFDRNGTVISRYRKINLFGEFTRTPALTPDLGIFETDFGVTFGHFICFDLMFQVPAVQVVQRHNITDVVFTTMWFSEMPYLTAVEIQQAYAHSMNVNFLAAGANNVQVGSAGSGIYSGRAGALVSIMPGVPTTRLLVSNVPKVPGEVSGTYPGPISDNPSTKDNLQLITDPSLRSHVTRVLRNGFQEFTLVDKDVACLFRINLNMREGEPSYRYRAAAFSGVRSFSGLGTGGARICSVFACTGNNITTCGQRFPTYQQNTTGVFQELTIVATVPTPRMDEELTANRSAYFPVSLDTRIMPLGPQDYGFVELFSLFDIASVYTFSLRNTTVDLYSAAVWGREYTTDGQIPTLPVIQDDETTTSTTTTTTTAAPSTPAADSAFIHKSSFILLVASIINFLRQ